MSNIRIKLKPEELKHNQSFKKTSSLEPIIDIRKHKNKKHAIEFSPYSNQNSKIQSFEKTTEIFKVQNKHHSNTKLSTINRNSSKNLNSLSSLLSEERVPKIDSVKTCKKLQKKLEDLFESIEYIDIYFDILDELISFDKEFGKVLTIFKRKLNSLLKNLKYERDSIGKNLKEANNLNNCLEAEMKQKTMENLQLQSKLDKIHDKYTDLSDKLIKLSKIEVPSDEVNLEVVKKLKQENIIYQDLIFKMKDELKFFKAKSKKFCKLLNVLENKGIPVEEIYLTELKKEKKMPKYSGESEVESCTDNENIISMRQLTYKKPDLVPSIDLMNLDKSSSDDSFISSLTPTERMLEF